jgi:hypothetical protein
VTTRSSFLAFLPGAAILAWHPCRWLVESWRDPSYQSCGWLAAVVVIILALRSFRSGRPVLGGERRRLGFALLILGALARLIGIALGIRAIGAMALLSDVYALGLMLELDRRPQPLSPAWLALLFTYALPLQHLLQRLLGFPPPTHRAPSFRPPDQNLPNGWRY